MLIPLAPRLLLLVLVSLQAHSTLFSVPALGLVNAFIPEDAFVLVILSDAPPEVSQLLRTLGKHLLSPLLPLRRRKVKRRRSVLVPGHLLPLESLQASSLTELPLSSSLLLSFPLLLKGEHILWVGMTKFLLRRAGAWTYNKTLPELTSYLHLTFFLRLSSLSLSLFLSPLCFLISLGSSFLLLLLWCDSALTQLSWSCYN